MVRPIDIPDEKLLADICTSYGTKSARIRALAEAGWPTAVIARALGIRYQHARNVILAADLKSTSLNRPESHKKAMAPYHLARLVTKGYGLPDTPKILKDAENLTGELMAAGINETDIAKMVIDPEYAKKRLTDAGINTLDVPEILRKLKNALEPLVAARINLSDISECADVAESTAAHLTANRECKYRYMQDALTNASQAGKKPVNLSINASLLAAAKLLNINLSETLENSLTALLVQRARELWQAENNEAIEAHNQFVERHGLWSDGIRQF